MFVKGIPTDHRGTCRGIPIASTRERSKALIEERYSERKTDSRGTINKNNKNTEAAVLLLQRARYYKVYYSCYNTGVQVIGSTKAFDLLKKEAAERRK